ncbi:Aryl-hydrocarbon-interacting protein-like 1 [Merluccius polli]|uniref:Aryl-hydrocarbon-interacting protein-like 1 n=1 Tax=Merluccius polli TaxID=89951 RepID=A0AA47P716_MERPO|nr:Aryl-hydrocarbon-interacting protein-like 1 [Merluccius polli]
MEDTYLLNMPSVKKKILAGGTGPMPHFPTGTKLVFHFQTLLDDFERTVIDDSRLANRPAEIFVGKMFKMEVWESLLTSMRVGEVAEFWCDAVHTGLYPIVSKGMRLIAQGKDPLDGQRHMCGMGNMFHYHSTGFPELDELMRTPQPLIFIMELLQVGDPMSYQRESWMMEKDEKMQTVPLLHMQGNTLVKMKRYEEAASKYKEAVLLLKVVQSREMHGDVDHINLGRMVIPLELNYCQCMLELERYYEVIEHTSELLEKHKDCVKGYYKRAKAHAAVWNEKEARRDFNMVLNLDLTLASLVHRELKELSHRMKEKYWEEKEQYWQKLEIDLQSEKDEEGSSEEEEEGDKEKEEEEEEEEENERGTKENAAGDKGVDGGSASVAMIDGVEEEDGRKEGACRGEGGEARGAGKTAGDGGDEEAGRGTETPLESVASNLTCPEGMDWQQMLRMVMFLQDEGNFHMKENRYDDAAGKFREAVQYVDFLQYKLVDQKGEDWQSLEKVRLPLTLNLSGCMLELHQYQQVVELNTKLLKKHKSNCKAVYQRAQAHSALCNEDEARRDFLRLERLDPKLQPAVRQELKKLGEKLRCMHGQQKKTYWETSQEKWGPARTQARAATAGRTPKNLQREPGNSPRTRPGAEEVVGAKEAESAEAPVAGLGGAERESHTTDVRLEEEGEKEEREEEEKEGEGREGGEEGMEEGVECGRVESNKEDEEGDEEEGREEGVECARMESNKEEEEGGEEEEEREEGVECARVESNKEEEEGAEEEERAEGAMCAGVESNKEESFVLRGDRQGAPDNGLRDGDSVPAPTGAAKDNVASKGSGSDKARNKVKYQSTAAQGQGRTYQGNKAADNGKGSAHTRSDAADGSE